MSCVFRIGGKSLDISALVGAIEMRPFRIWHKDTPRHSGYPNNKMHPDSGACFSASEAGMDEFEVQLDDATAFLNRSQSDFGKIKAFPGVEYAELDFGIKLRDSYTHSDVLPSKFLQAVAESGVSIALTHYRTDDAEQTDQVNLASAEDGH